MNSLLQDARVSFRQLTKTPGFTLTAILTLAVAIGVNTAMFSLINGVVFRPVVPHKPEEVVNVFTSRADAKRDYRQFSHAEFQALRETNEVFSEVAACEFSLAGIDQNGALRRSFVFFASENLLELLGAKPFRGRFFTAEEARPNAGVRIAVASHDLWTRLGGRDDFVGSSLRVNDQLYTIVGITPPGFSGVNAIFAPDLWLPFGINGDFTRTFSDSPGESDLNSPTNYTLNVTARLHPGLSLDAASARLPVLTRRLQEMQPADGLQGERALEMQVPSRFSLSTDPSDDGPIALFGTLLLAMSGIVLLIACLNLANMMLARGTGRSREVAIRLAVGATRWVIVRQLFVEGLMLALAGGVAGLLMSYWTGGLVIASFSKLLHPMSFSITLQPEPDLVVMLATFALCVVATAVFSLGPALRASRVDVVTDLKQGGNAGSRIAWNRLFSGRSMLVMSQLALSLALIFASGLFFRAALKAANLENGFDPRGNIVTEIDYSLTRTAPEQSLPRALQLLEHVRSQPGIASAGIGTLVPYGNVSTSKRIAPAAAPANAADPDSPEAGFSGLFVAASDRYFETIGVSVIRGRDFSPSEVSSPSATGVAIIDERMASSLFPGSDALGQRVRFTQVPKDGTPTEMEIVGIVNSHRRDTLSPNMPRRIYVPLAHGFSGAVFMHAKLASADAESAAVGPLRDSLRRFDPTLPVIAMRTFSDVMDANFDRWVIRFAATLFGVFGLVALILAAVGVYGVNSYSVASRTREIGVRMAIGARAQDVLLLILGQGLRQAMLAIAVGAGLSFLVGTALASMLFHVNPHDPVVLGVAVIVLCGAAMAACIVPARRATRVDPMKALRAD